MSYKINYNLRVYRYTDGQKLEQPLSVPKLPDKRDPEHSKMTKLLSALIEAEQPIGGAVDKYFSRIFNGNDVIPYDVYYAVQASSYVLSERLGPSGDGFNWNEEEAEMKRISKLYPGCVFALYLDGEEDGDKRVHYYYGGKTKHCNAEVKTVYPEFDASKLR